MCAIEKSKSHGYSVSMKDFGSIGVEYGDGNENNKCYYTLRLDTYGCGCAHDCSYCYAKSMLDFRKNWDSKHPSVANLGQLSREIKKLKSGTIVRLGGMTDCFQPIEKLYRMTYKTIRLLNRRGIGYLIVTKSATVADDEYIEIYDPKLCHIQVTVTTLDDDLARTYEKASPPSERIKAIQKLQKAGFDVQLRLSPYIPQYMDLERLNSLNIDKILVEFLRANSWIKKWFPIDYSEYTVKQHGYIHLPLEKKIDLIKGITGFKEITVGEDEERAYAYWRDHFNPNPNDCCNLRR